MSIRTKQYGLKWVALKVPSELQEFIYDYRKFPTWHIYSWTFFTHENLAWTWVGVQRKGGKLGSEILYFSLALTPFSPISQFHEEICSSNKSCFLTSRFSIYYLHLPPRLLLISLLKLADFYSFLRSWLNNKYLWQYLPDTYSPIFTTSTKFGSRLIYIASHSTLYFPHHSPFHTIL